MREILFYFKPTSFDLCPLIVYGLHCTVEDRSSKMSWHMEEGGIMCFKPTMDQFRNFSKFIEFMESKGAHKCGVAKVVFD